MTRMERFKKVYTQGALDVLEVWVDTETGVNYLYHRTGNAGGLTVLLDKDGKPVVTPAEV
ncbi:xylan 1,4-beta-xylosidase [Faecalibacterium sp. An77]|nr:xylan 1,4-beta-xylosidase [Faecalibacterium sp. An77]